jgi:hypothetical protein
MRKILRGEPFLWQILEKTLCLLKGLLQFLTLGAMLIRAF